MQVKRTRTSSNLTEAMSGPNLQLCSKNRNECVLILRSDTKSKAESSSIQVQTCYF